MQKTKKIISLLLTIQMLFACTLVPSAMATDSVVEEPIDEVVEALAVDEGESPEELSPMMAARCANDYNHIFGNPDHNLEPFLAYYGGNQSAAYGAVLDVAQSYVTSNGIMGIIDRYNQITVNVCGFYITVRGNVINGVLRIGTFFIISEG